MDNQSSLNSPTIQSVNSDPSLPHPPDPPEPHKHTQPITIWVISIIAILLAITTLSISVSQFFTQSQSATEDPSTSGPQQYESLQEVNYGFLKQEAAPQNIIYSPLSIRNGLALLNCGANGETKDEIEGLLTHAEIPKYQNIPNQLSLANAVFINDSFKNDVLPSYINTVQNDYDGAVLYDSFDNSDNLDNWVKQNTFNLINDIGIQVSPSHKMILANTLAIQANWKYRFDTDDTYGRPFIKEDGTEIKATTMHQEIASEDVKYLVDENITAVSLPLKFSADAPELSFIAIMPSSGLSAFISNLNEENVDTILNSLAPSHQLQNGVNISIPKFKFEYSLNFMDDLQSLGVKSIFNHNKADFSNMSSTPLYVDEAIHKANIDFSEDGIKAAAVTAFSMKASSALEEDSPLNITIDHPFFFLIRDNSNGTIWFTGAVHEPNLWADDKELYY